VTSSVAGECVSHSATVNRFEALESLSTGNCYSTNTWTIFTDRACITSGHCGISGISGSHCLMKLSMPSLAVWLVPASITTTLFFLECQNWITPKYNVDRTRWRASFCAVESLNTLRQRWNPGTLMNTGQPTYLRQLLEDYEPIRYLRSSSKKLICISDVGTILASCDFRHSAVSVWNNLPGNIHDAKNQWLFKRKPKANFVNSNWHLAA